MYFVLGAEGSGNTSLFLASKFEPELLAGQVHRESVVVPTRLGNILKASELYANQRYGLDPVLIWSRLYGLLPESAIATVRAGRNM